MAALEPTGLEPELEIIDLTGETTASEEEEEDLSDVSSDGPDAASRAQLHAAIYTVPEARLRDVLADLVDRAPAVYQALARELITANPATRVVIPRWETCASCGETYDVNADDGEEECIFHPGNLQVNEAKFLDWDEDCHGPMDSAHDRDEYPENFSWSCCNGDGMAEGCVNGQHSVAVHKKRRLA
ncbi:hypothetical protein C8F04DRAFT_949746 [Mycena alexandri]|uniref:C2H2-type domain-containing protein n=1 Tax=Mycena alexandri TaxID=1745969 RepID=A0AAD6T4L3_9AGAR|nr:hypothetical protein C8F04DRAFT_949746 [Mycena alexandri]